MYNVCFDCSSMWNLSFSSYVYQYVNISYVINSSILGGKRDRRWGGAWGMEVVNGCEEGKWPPGESSWHAKRAGASISLIPFTQICKPFNLRLCRLCFLSIRLFKPNEALTRVQLLLGNSNDSSLIKNTQNLFKLWFHLWF